MTEKKFDCKTSASVETSFKKWQSQIELKPVMTRYLAMLQVFDVAPAMGSSEIDSLNELGAVRNVLMHNSGFVDDKFREKCSTTQFKIGDRITIERDRMKKYFDAASEFTKEFFATVMKSDYFMVGK